MAFVADISRPVYGEWVFGWLDGYANMQKLGAGNAVGSGLRNATRYRYYRVIATDTLAANDQFGVAEVELREFAGSPDTTAPGVQAVTTSSTSGNPGSNLIDNTNSSTWTSNPANVQPHWFYVDYGADPMGWRAINQLLMRARQIASGGTTAPTDFKLQGSFDLVGFTDLITKVAEAAWADTGEIRTYLT